MMQREKSIAPANYRFAGALPSLPGVEGLSIHEIHSDLCELQRVMSPTDTDADNSSVSSDDILDSHYPVKPRRTIRLFEREEFVVEIEKSEASPEVEEALKMLQLLGRSHKELLEGEAEREELEGTFESYKLRVQQEAAAFGATKASYGGYLCVLQSLLIRAMQTQQSQQRLVHRLSDLHSALRGWKQYAAHLQTLSAPAAATVSTTKKQSGGLKGKAAAGSEIALLSLPSSSETPSLLLGPGSEVFTPFGPARIINWDADAARASLQLPYGRMSASLSALRDWRHDELQRFSISALCSRPLSFLDVVRDSQQLHQHPQLCQSSSVADMASTSVSIAANSASEDNNSENSDSTDKLAQSDDQMPPPEDQSRANLRSTAAVAPQLLRPALLAALAPDSSSLKALVSTTAQQLRINPAALQSDARYPHDGEGQLVAHLRNSLQGLRAEQKGLALMRDRLEQQLVRRRREIAQTSIASAALRLRMFTRRYCHRSALVVRGVPLPPQHGPPAQTATNVKSTALPRALKEIAAMNLINANHNGGGSSGNGNGAQGIGALAMAADMHRFSQPGGQSGDDQLPLGQRRARRHVQQDESGMDDDDELAANNSNNNGGGTTGWKRGRDDDGPQMTRKK